MTAKTITSIVIAITILFVLLVTTQTQAEEVLPQKKPVELKIKSTVDSIKNWANNEWIEIVEYQKASWEQGKEQTAKNFEKIKSFLVDKTTNR
jgi:predicted PurR-regulated permease PerM